MGRWFMAAVLCMIIPAMAAQNAIEISQQPSDVVSSVGRLLQIGASANSSATGYRWYKDGQPLAGKAGTSLTALLAYNKAEVIHTGDYFVVFTNATLSVTSRVARVFVVPPGPPYFTRHPQSVAIGSNDMLLLSGSAFGSGGVLSYFWLHEGTNISAGSSSLRLNAPDPRRFGRFQLVAVMTPGGSSTSDVAVVTSKSDTPVNPPRITVQPGNQTVFMGSDAILTAVVESSEAVSISWFRSNQLLRVDGPALTLSPLLTNTFPIQRVGPLNDGIYWMMASNRLGAVTSAPALVSYVTPSPARIVQDITNTWVEIGQYQRTNIMADLAALKAGQYKSLEISLQEEAAGASAGSWILALGSNGQYYAHGDGFASPVQGAWGTNSSLLLTNFAGPATVASMDAHPDGRYAIQSGGAARSGRYIVLGPRRPAQIFLTADIFSTNTFLFAWQKDGVTLQLPQIPSAKTPYARISTIPNAPGGPGAVNRYQLIIPDAAPLDAGAYNIVISNTAIYGALQGGAVFGTTTSVETGRTARVEVHGWTETNAPRVQLAMELHTGAKDEVTALSVLPDGSSLMGLRRHPLSLQPRGRLLCLTADGATNWQSSEWTLPSADNEGIRGVASDGEGGAFIGGAEDNLRYWFLRRLRPQYDPNTGRILGVTNAWTLRVYGGADPAYENVFLGDGLADVVAMAPVEGGFVAAGHFRGRVRFGAIPTGAPGGSSHRIVSGGIVLTNSSDSTRDIYLSRYDSSGELLWIRQLGTTNDDAVASLDINANADIVIGGSFKGSLAFGGKTYNSTVMEKSAGETVAGQDGFVARFTAAGDPVWFQAVGGADVNFIPVTTVTAVAITGKGQAYFAASRPIGQSFLRPGIYTGTRFIGMLDSLGRPLWAQSIEGAFADSTSLLADDPEGNVLLADGLKGIAAIDALPVWTGTTLAKLGPDGRLLWLRPLDRPSPGAYEARPAQARHMGMDRNGRVLLAGVMSARPGVAQSPSIGQQFDAFDLILTNFISGDSLDLFVARLDPEHDNGAAEMPVLRFTLPQPGMKTLRLEWPSGYKLQRAGKLSSGGWQTLDAPSPYHADPFAGGSAFFRVVKP